MATVNPIIPGFSPDPSICRIGNTFFLVNSSFHLFPGLPIYASKDLISFKHIGNAINHRTQLSLRGSSTKLNPGENGDTMLATGGLFAPTIRHAHGITYIVCTNAIRDLSNDRKENFMIKTDDIWSGEWSDPVYFPFSGIDPSIFFDDDGRVYIQGCISESRIICFEINLNTGESLTEQKVIWTGWDKNFTEGPHIYKRDGWYYLLCAEGGTFDHHLVSMARSRDIWGPYDAYSRNPIWTAYGTGNYVQHTGHADLVQDNNDQWWAVILGVRKRHGRFVMGRETFLTAFDWPVGEWPLVKPVEGGAGDIFPVLDGSRLEALPDVDWVFLRDFDPNRYQIHGRNVRVTGSSVPLTSPDESASFIGKRQRALEGSCLVNISARCLPGEVQLNAGLALYKDEHRFIAVGIDFMSKQVFFNVFNKAKNITRLTTHDVSFDKDDVLSVKCSYTEVSYEFSFRMDRKSTWSTVGIVDTLEMTGYDYVGPVFGLFVVGEAEEVTFEEFLVDTNN